MDGWLKAVEKYLGRVVDYMPVVFGAVIGLNLLRMATTKVVGPVMDTVENTVYSMGGQVVGFLPSLVDVTQYVPKMSLTSGDPGTVNADGIINITGM